MWDKVVDLNLKSVFRLTALVGSRMVRDGGGSVINVSSVGSIRPNATILPYAAAKAGVNSLTLGFAQALGPSVRVNCIMAGPFLTDVTKAWDMEAFEQGAQRFALKRGGRARRGRRGRPCTSPVTRRASPPASCCASTAASPDPRRRTHAGSARVQDGAGGPGSSRASRRSSRGSCPARILRRASSRVNHCALSTSGKLRR